MFNLVEFHWYGPITFWDGFVLFWLFVGTVLTVIGVIWLFCVTVVAFVIGAIVQGLEAMSRTRARIRRRYDRWRLKVQDSIEDSFTGDNHGAG